MFQQISKFLNNNKNSKKIEDIRIRFVNPSNDLDDEISKLNDDEIKNKAKDIFTEQQRKQLTDFITLLKNADDEEDGGELIYHDETDWDVAFLIRVSTEKQEHLNDNGSCNGT